ncbi:hypothetical protein SDC9_65972 [bioreactor metagenome]|uniref:Adenylosuccinate lyase C-terminal domain-containing protein n=1 Tax=bioreactor metagenome TaxID=1076179 RepID=A0A644XTJ9_9ZZZZ
MLVENETVRQHLSEAEIDTLLDPETYLGSAPQKVDEVLQRFAATGLENSAEGADGQ